MRLLGARHQSVAATAVAAATLAAATLTLAAAAGVCIEEEEIFRNQSGQVGLAHGFYFLR